MHPKKATASIVIFRASVARRRIACLVVLWFAGVGSAVTLAEDGRRLLGEVLPVLKEKCFACHGDDSEYVRGEFDIRSRAGLLAGGESEEPALVPGNPQQSPLYTSVTWTDRNLQMPPKQNDRLTTEQVESIRRWIEAGAPWPDTPEVDRSRAAESQGWADSPGEDGIVLPISAGQSADWSNRRWSPEDVWAYLPLANPVVPNQPADSTADRHPIDAFIARKLADKRIEPSPQADRRTLIRRVSFDLTGLPPTPEEIATFVGDESPDAYHRLVDRLLRSPRYGEQMARHWFDVVRYADTGGFSNDFERPNAWRYRDYVIRSLNDDKLFDRFILEQIAGDELEPENPQMLIPVGFLRMGPWEHTGMSVAAVTRQQFLDDVTNSVGVSFLGQGLRCARCHDHKFDPIPTKDYYSVQAVFAPVQFAERRVSYAADENTSSFARLRAQTEQRLAESQAHLARVRKKHQDAVAQYLRSKGVKNASELPPDERPRAGFFGLTSLEMSLEKMHRKWVAYFERELERYEPLALSVYNGPPSDYSSIRASNPMPQADKLTGPVQKIHVLAGGAIDSPGEEVAPGVLTAVGGSAENREPGPLGTIPHESTGRRLALARWISSDKNTLTARVIVNRAWQWHFGRGIVETPNNFGRMGGRPSHPELLDWLARWFIDHNWSIKSLNRLIVTSDTYQRSSDPVDYQSAAEADPKNALLSYFPVRRLAAEEIRDAMLTVGGQMNHEMGGPGFFAEINWEVALQPRHIMGTVAPSYQPSPLPQQRHRRTVYAFRFRTLGDPMLEVFDRPPSDISCERRTHATIAPQAFALLNGQFVHDRALALAQRLEAETDHAADRIDRAFWLVYGRPSGDRERNWCLAHLARSTDHHNRHTPAVIAPPRSVHREMVEELTGEPYQWDEPLSGMEHYRPDTKPWDVGPETRALAEVCLVLLNSNEFLYVR